MAEAPTPTAITIRPVRAEDVDGITRTYIESAEHHARLDPERYSVPAREAIAARYREGSQHPRVAHICLPLANVGLLPKAAIAKLSHQ
jgi:hypothetical protein